MLTFFQTLPERLARVTSGGKLISEIDGLRFFAILPVLVQHLHERFSRNSPIAFAVPLEQDFSAFVASRGFMGVYIFFVISGFILALPFASHRLHQTKKIKLGDYYWRRVTRLEPPYILWISLFFLVYLVHSQGKFLEQVPHFLASLTYTHALFYGEWSPINPPTWTLEIEIQFYLLAPFLAALFFRFRDKLTRRVVNIAFLIGLMLLQQYFQTFLGRFSLSILGHLHFFLIGFFLADIYLCDWKGGRSRSRVFDFVAVASLVALVFIWDWDFPLFNRLGVVLVLFCFFFSVFKSVHVNRFVSNRWLTAIGGMCYTIYLIHLPFAEFMMVFTKDLALTHYYWVNLALQLCLYLPLVLAFSAVFFLLFEKPFMDKNWTSKLAGMSWRPTNLVYLFKLALGLKAKQGER